MTYDLATLTTILAMVAMVAAASERTVELLKPLIMRLDRKASAGTWKALSIIVGAGIYYVNPELHIGPDSPYTTVLVGLCVSAGAGLWHDLLGVVTSMKVTK